VSEKQLFSVLVRAVGIVVFLDGFRVLWFAVAAWLFPFTPEQRWPFAMVEPNLAYGLLVVVLGAMMFRWPEWLLNLAWPPEPPSDQD
jgi:hypothetical protein